VKPLLLLPADTSLTELSRTRPELLVLDWPGWKDTHSLPEATGRQRRRAETAPVSLALTPSGSGS